MSNIFCDDKDHGPATCNACIAKSSNRVQERYGDEMECPHCGTKQSDPWEYGEESGKVDCDKCENQFHYSRFESVSYTTWLKP